MGDEATLYSKHRTWEAVISMQVRLKHDISVSYENIHMLTVANSIETIQIQPHSFH